MLILTSRWSTAIHYLINQMKIINFWRVTFAALSLVAASHLAAAPVLMLDANGVLTGAHNIEVAGKLYDVAFSDTACDRQNPTCSILFFASYEEISAASQALLDQVFVDGPAGNFDSFTNKILGCTSTALCQSLIPYGTNSTASVINRSAGDEIGDYYFVGNNPFGQDFSLFAAQNYAFFTSLDPGGEVPEPGSLALFGVGVAALALMRRLASAM